MGTARAPGGAWERTSPARARGCSRGTIPPTGAAAMLSQRRGRRAGAGLAATSVISGTGARGRRGERQQPCGLPHESTPHARASRERGGRAGGADPCTTRACLSFHAGPARPVYPPHLPPSRRMQATSATRVILDTATLKQHEKRLAVALSRLRARPAGSPGSFLLRPPAAPRRLGGLSNALQVLVVSLGCQVGWRIGPCPPGFDCPGSARGLVQRGGGLLAGSTPEAHPPPRR
jgi:hypothetical protein